MTQITGIASESGTSKGENLEPVPSFASASLNIWETQEYSHSASFLEASWSLSPRSADEDEDEEEDWDDDYDEEDEEEDWDDEDEDEYDEEDDDDWEDDDDEDIDDYDEDEDQ